MNPTIPCLLFVLSLLSLFSVGKGQPSWFFLATGNGVIQAQQSTSISGTLSETINFCNFCQEQQWELVHDDRFPNGYFIRSIAYSNLVWDSQNGLATSGNPIILYQQKDTLVDTKNQRWVVTSADQFSLIANANFVAKVIHSGSSSHIALAAKNSSDPFQKFYQLSPTDIAEVTVLNWLPHTVFVGFVTIIGNRSPAEQLWQGYTYNIPTGSKINIYASLNGALLYNGTITSSGATIALPRNDLPLGTHQWVGWSRPPPNNGPNDATLTLTWSNDSNQVVTGSGTDSYGSFTIENGTYDLGGGINFDRVYATITFHSCSGGLYNTTNTLTGACYDDNWAMYDFQYTLV